MLYIYTGFCEETRWVTKTRRNYQGEEETDHVSETQRVDGFDFKIDTSQYVSSSSQGIYILPNNNETTPRVRQLCNDYVRSKNVLKELKLTKEINWDFQKLAEGKSRNDHKKFPYQLLYEKLSRMPFAALENLKALRSPSRQRKKRLLSSLTTGCLV